MIFEPVPVQPRVSTTIQERTVDLAACRQFIEAHGGHLWAESRPGSWANFILTLPKRRV
jgi:sensor histidine kinase regulating citrate/malate metabolism